MMSRKLVKDTRKVADLKIVMVGDACVGKTCMIVRHMEHQFKESNSTIGASFVLKDWGNFCVSIWDTAGEEKYAGLTTFYYRNASAAILTFDMFDRQTYYNLNQRYIPILNDVGTPELKVVVATKCDLLTLRQRQVSYREGMELAMSINPQMDFSDGRFVPFFETSSKTGQNVDDVFEYILHYFYPDGKAKSRPCAVPELTDSIQIDSRKSMHRSCC